MKIQPEEPMHLGAAAGSLRPYGDEHHLSILANPATPAADALVRIYTAAGAGLDGMRALWRHGCDAGMVAPSTSLQPVVLTRTNPDGSLLTETIADPTIAYDRGRHDAERTPSGSGNG